MKVTSAEDERIINYDYRRKVDVGISLANPLFRVFTAVASKDKERMRS
jgi:hypothetical protein